MGLWRFADMERLELCGSDGPMPVGIGYWFYGFFHTLCG